MKWFFTILLLVCASNINAQTVSPENLTATASLSNTEKKITFRVRWVQTQSVDSTMVAVFLSNSEIPVLYRRGRSPDTISFTVPDDTTTYRFLLVNIRRGLSSIPATVNFYFNANQYYQISRLHIRPKTITVDTNGTVQFCAFLEFNDGSIVIRDKDRTNPICLMEYDKFSVELRKTGGARQRNANGVCLQWQATGGTIQSESCS